MMQHPVSRAPLGTDPPRFHPYGCPPLETLIAVARLSSDAIVLIREEPEDGTQEIAWTNPALDRLLAQPSGHLLGHPIFALHTRHLAPAGGDVAGAVAATAGQGALQDLLGVECGQSDVSIRRADGSLAVVRASVAPVAGPRERYWAVIMREIGDEVRADEHLRASEERFRALAVNAPIGIFFSEVGLRLGYVNDRFADLFGRESEELAGMGWLASVHPDDVEPLVAALSSVLGGEEIDQLVRIHRPDGALRWVRTRATPMRLAGRGAGFIGSLEDVTDRRRHEEELARQASHDPLTGLPNRTLLWSKLTSLLEGRREGDPAAALLFFDLDNFKMVNDSLGHLIGDRLLIEVAHRLCARLRPGDVVARLGGDEFVVMCPAVASEADAVGIADRLLASLDQPLHVLPYEIRVTASVGIAVTADRSVDAETLLRNADVAMYQAKGAGRARGALFDADVRSEIEDRLSLTMDLRRAIETGQLTLAYQPVVDMRTGQLSSVEALARWYHPTRGPVPPSEFVPLAEETGTIIPLGAWVLGQACTQLRAWRDELGPAAPRCVSVNISAHQLTNPDFPRTVIDALAAAGLTGTDLCLELTESVLMSDADASTEALSTLQAVGVRFAIDDFGTGYSSLAYLRRFSVEVLKIDRSFVAGLDDANEDAAIVEAIISMASSLGVAVVAEGVETPSQLARLHELGCRYAQGYHLGRPTSAELLTARLRTRPRSDSAPSEETRSA